MSSDVSGHCSDITDLWIQLGRFMDADNERRYNYTFDGRCLNGAKTHKEAWEEMSKIEKSKRVTQTMSDKTTCLAIYVAEQRAVDEDREYTYGAIVFHIHIDHVINILRDICRIKVDGFNGNLTFCLVQNTSIQDKQGKPNGQWHIGTEEPPDILCRRLTGSEYTVQGSFPGYVQYSINEVIDMFSWGVLYMLVTKMDNLTLTQLTQYLASLKTST